MRGENQRDRTAQLKHISSHHKMVDVSLAREKITIVKSGLTTLESEYTVQTRLVGQCIERQWTKLRDSKATPQMTSVG